MSISPLFQLEWQLCDKVTLCLIVRNLGLSFLNSSQNVLLRKPARGKKTQSGVTLKNDQPISYLFLYQKGKTKEKLPHGEISLCVDTSSV